MNGVPRSANLGAPVAAARTSSDHPPTQNATPMAGVRRQANLGAPVAAARAPSPHPPTLNAPQMTGASRPVSSGAVCDSATAVRAPSPSPPMQNAPRPANYGAPARAPSPRPQMKNASQMTGGVQRPANYGASGPVATAPYPPVQNAPRMAAGATSAPSPEPQMQRTSPAGQMSSHTAVAGTGIQTARPRAMRGAIPAMTPAMVPTSSHTTVATVPSMRPPHAPSQRAAMAPTGVPTRPVQRPQAPQAQGAPSMAMSPAPGVPTIPTPTGQPHAPQQPQRPPMARQPVPNNGAPPARAMPPPPSPAAATPLQPQAQATNQTRMRINYIGVQRDSVTGRFAACVVDPDTNRPRAVGAFPDAHAAALAHDRLAIAFHGVQLQDGGGGGGRLNFAAAFHYMEHRFLCYLRGMNGSSTGMICNLVANDGKYDDMYSRYMRQVYKVAIGESSGARYTNLLVEFYIGRASEIGAAIKGTRAQLVERFVEMHKNKATNPGWRQWYFNKKMAQKIAEQQQEGVTNKRKADGEDDQQHKRQQLSPENPPPSVSGT